MKELVQIVAIICAANITARILDFLFYRNKDE